MSYYRTSNDEKIIVANKSFNKKYLAGHIFKGGGTIDLGDGYSLSFVSNGSFTEVQLYRHSKDTKVQIQNWSGSQKEEIIKKPVKDIKESGELFEV